MMIDECPKCGGSIDFFGGEPAHGNNLYCENELCGWEAWNSEERTEKRDPIVQVSGFGVENTVNTQANYMLVGLTKSGKVVMSTGDGKWADVSPR